MEEYKIELGVFAGCVLIVVLHFNFLPHEFDHDQMEELIWIREQNWLAYLNAQYVNMHKV